MNSEELELSLRTEFENYLKGVFADLRQNVSEFQKNFDAEFEKHKLQMDEAIRDLSKRFESEKQFDRAFTESVIEHLRLARDEGAQLSANAFVEAEKLQQQTASPANFDLVRDAINDISGRPTQAAILTSLVEHAGKFAPRGAFFIVKTDHLVGWKPVGPEAAIDESSLRSIRIPLSAETLIADAVNSASTREGEHADDEQFLGPLGYGHPDKKYAIPLTARGRGVAVLYADHGSEGKSLNIDALEMLMRVAGLTVELLAASQSLQAQTGAAEIPTPEPGHAAYAQPVETEEVTPGFEPVQEQPDVPAVYEGELTVEEEHIEAPTVHDAETSVSFEGHHEEDAAAVGQEAEAAMIGEEAVEDVTYFEPVPAEEQSTPSTDFAFSSGDTYDGSQSAAEEPASEPAPEFAYAGEKNGNGATYEHTPDPVVEVSSVQSGRGRLGDRNVDLPIEVSDEERPLHNGARRFARLLVSEIKLYNEQKVNEGREYGDLYDRLREAIDRSREMYEKRVQPPVAAKFDYFHYELVTNLAEGDANRLGASYPGSAI